MSRIIKAIFHIHTDASRDCNISPHALIDACLKKSIGLIIITDHNTIDGAMLVKELAPSGLKVIVGEEIKTKEGEIIGIFMKNAIKEGLSLSETMQIIKKQDGIVCVPHPCDTLRKERINNDALLKNIKEIDIVETFNARNILSRDNMCAYDMAKKYNKKQIVGSDAHTLNELDSTIMELAEFSNKREFLHSLENASFLTKKSPLVVHVKSKIIKLYNFIK